MNTKPLNVPERDYSSDRPFVTIKLDRKIVKAFIGIDGSAWIETDHGQRIIADAKDARSYLSTRAIDDVELEKAKRMTREPESEKVASALNNLLSRKGRGNR